MVGWSDRNTYNLVQPMEFVKTFFFIYLYRTNAIFYDDINDEIGAYATTRGGAPPNPSSTVSALIRHKMLEFSKDFEPRAAVRT